MNKETFDRAVELKNIIEYLDICLKSGKGFGVTSWYMDNSNIQNCDFPHLLNQDIKSVIRKHLDKYKEEFENL